MPNTRKRITAPHPEKDEPDFTQSAFEDEDIEEEFDEEDESEEDEEYDDEIRVTYKEILIKRRFAVNQETKSGGVLTRSFNSVNHGKKYRSLACQFVETLMLNDEDTRMRPRLIKVEGLSGEEILVLDLRSDGTPKANPNGTVVVPVMPTIPSKFEDV